MKKTYKELTNAENLIKSLEEAVKYEKGEKVKGLRTHTITIAPLPDYLNISTTLPNIYHKKAPNQLRIF